MEDARNLLLGDLEFRGRHTELGEGGFDLGETWASSRRATGEPGSCRRGDPDEQRCQRAERCTAGDDRASDHTECHHPVAECPPGACEVRRDGHDHRSCLGKTHVREGGCASCSDHGVRDVGPGANREPHDDDREECSKHERSDRLREHDKSKSHDGDADEHEREQPGQIGEESPDGVEPARHAREEALQRDLEAARRVRDHCRSKPDERDDEEHEIGCAARPWLAARGGEDLQPAREKLGRSVHASIAGRRIHSLGNPDHWGRRIRRRPWTGRAPLERWHHGMIDGPPEHRLRMDVSRATRVNAPLPPGNGQNAASG